jgi:hypothetical protein
MSDKTVPEKLQGKAGRTFKIINQPEETISILSQLPEGASFSGDHEPGDILLIFVKTMEEVKALFPISENILKQGGIPWLAYPKKTSGIVTDLDRDIIWRYLQTIGWTGVSMISIDETWSGFRMKKVG